MPTAENAQMYYESGVDYSDGYKQLYDIGDNTTFRSAALRWSRQSGYKPTVRPNGLVNGGTVSVGSGNNNASVAAGTVYIGGESLTFAADTSVTVWRGASSDTHRITSIQVRKSASGTAVVISKPGTDHSAFSSTRGAAGGPPLIGHKEVEIAQVRTTAVAAAAITSDEIYAVPAGASDGSCEWYNYPSWDVNYADVSSKLNRGAGITFHEALPDSHQDPSAAPKHVYAEYYEPTFSKIGKCVDFVPIETSWSTSSTQIYDGRTIGAASSSLGQGAFTAYTEDNITDLIVSKKNADLWFKWLQDSTVTTTYIQTQGRFGISRTNPANDNLMFAATISGEEASQEITSEASLTASTTTTTTSA